MEIETRPTRDGSITLRIEAGERQKAEAAAIAAGITLSELARTGLREVTRSILGKLAAEK
jgi:hypothetical protein